MKTIATWNVNSLKVRLPQVLQWLRENPVDILALQETKLINDKFPLSEIKEAGYHAAFNGQKTYNGVAILSRYPVVDITIKNPYYEDPQHRIISATVDGIRIICIYVPNGQSLDSEKYTYKLEWLDSLYKWVKDECKLYPKLILLGDYNIAIEEDRKSVV